MLSSITPDAVSQLFCCKLFPTAVSPAQKILQNTSVPQCNFHPALSESGCLCSADTTGEHTPFCSTPLVGDRKSSCKTTQPAFSRQDAICPPKLSEGLPDTLQASAEAENSPSARTLVFPLKPKSCAGPAASILCSAAAAAPPIWSRGRGVRPAPQWRHGRGPARRGPGRGRRCGTRSARLLPPTPHRRLPDTTETPSARHRITVPLAKRESENGS